MSKTRKHPRSYKQMKKKSLKASGFKSIKDVKYNDSSITTVNKLTVLYPPSSSIAATQHEVAPL